MRHEDVEKHVLAELKVITESEENKYSDIPDWDGTMISYTSAAALLQIGEREVWFPLSQLRKADDEQSVYASIWILEQKGLG